MQYGNTASAPPGANVELGYGSASAPPTYNDFATAEGYSTANAPPPGVNVEPGYGTAAAPPAYGTGEGETTANAAPPSYYADNGVNPIKVDDSKADREFQQGAAYNRAAANNLGPTEWDAGVSVNVKLDEYADDPWQGAGCIPACKRNAHLKSWLLTLGTITLILLVILVDTGTVWIGYDSMLVIYIFLGVFGFSYLVEICCSSSFSYLRESHEQEATLALVHNMKKAAPCITWHVQCYHYETRHHTRRDSEGNIEHYTTQERVNTWSATENFRFNHWSDASPALGGMGQFRLTKLKLNKRYVFANQFTKNEFNRQKVSFKENNRRDTHQDFSESFIVPGFKDRLLCEAVKGDKPGCLNAEYYCLFHLLFLGPCYRWWFSSICGNKTQEIVKLFSCNGGVQGAV